MSKVQPCNNVIQGNCRNSVIKYATDMAGSKNLWNTDELLPAIFLQAMPHEVWREPVSNSLYKIHWKAVLHKINNNNTDNISEILNTPDREDKS